MKLTALAVGAAMLFSSFAVAATTPPPQTPDLSTKEKTFAYIAEEMAKLQLMYRDGWSIEEMNEQIDQTNFLVNRGCSGTLVDLENRYVLTAGHCVEAQYETVEREVVADDGTVSTEKIRKLKPGVVRQLTFDGALEIREITYRTTLVAVDKIRDLALLQILAEIPNTVAADFACDEPVRGQQVFVVGNPMGNLYSSVVVGIISSLQRTYGLIDLGTAPDEPLMQVSGGVIGGNSGGAVYNADGELIGVPVASHSVNEVLGFAVPLVEIKAFLAEKKLLNLDCEEK